MEDTNLKNLQKFFDTHKSLTITNLNLPVPYLTTKDVQKSRPAFRQLGKMYSKYSPLGALDRMEKREKKSKGGIGGLLKGARAFKEKKEYEITKDKMKLESFKDQKKGNLDTLKKGVVGKFIESTPIGQFFGVGKAALEELGFTFDKEKTRENKKLKLEEKLNEWQHKEYIPVQLKVKDAFEQFTRIFTRSKKLTTLEEHKKKGYERKEDKETKSPFGKFSVTDLKGSPLGTLFTREIAQEDTLSSIYKYIRGSGKYSKKEKRKDDKYKTKWNDSLKDNFNRVKKSLGFIGDNTKKDTKEEKLWTDKGLTKKETTMSQKVIGGISILAGLGMMGKDFKEGGLKQAIMGKSFGLYEQKEGKRKFKGNWKDIGMTALGDVGKYAALGYGAGSMFGSPEMGLLAGVITGAGISTIKFLWELLGPWVEDLVYWFREIFTWAVGFGEKSLAFAGKSIEQFNIMKDDVTMAISSFLGGGLAVTPGKFKFKKGTYLEKATKDYKITKGEEYNAYKEMNQQLLEFHNIKAEFGEIKQKGVEKYGEGNLKDLSNKIKNYMSYIQGTFESDSDYYKEALKLQKEQTKLIEDQLEMAKHGSYQNREKILIDWRNYIGKEDQSINNLYNK